MYDGSDVPFGLTISILKSRVEGTYELKENMQFYSYADGI